MFRFENETFLWLLLVIPLVCLIKVIADRKTIKAIRRLGDEALVGRMSAGVSWRRRNIKFILKLIALTSIILILARPIAGTRRISVEKSDVEVYIAMDVSNSMLAEDVQPSRLERSKALVNNVVERLENHKLGLVVYAGDAFIQLPVTSDNVSAKMFVQSVSPTMIESQGTDIAKAVRLASCSFSNNESSKKAIVIITDGEDHEKEALKAVNEASSDGISIFVVGVGTTEGANIPYDGEYLKDDEGNLVVSKLDEQMCKTLAQEGKGKYMNISSTLNVERWLANEIDQLQRGNTDTITYDSANEQFQAFALIALLLLIIAASVGRFGKVGSLRSRTLSIVFAIIIIPFGLQAQTSRDFIRKGNAQYRKGNIDEAEVLYRKSLSKDKTNSQALYNLACVIMNKKSGNNYADSAVSLFNEAAKAETNKLRKAMSFHNIGIVYQGSKDYANAIEAYKQALKLDPHNDKTRYNLAKCQYYLKRQKQQMSNNKGNNENENENENENDKKKDKSKSDKNENQSKNKDEQKRKNNNQISKDNVNQLLNAAIRDEQKTQQRLRKAMRQPGEKRNKKNW